jgi:predicted DNA-binding transcriptional regulator AlpA
MIRRGEFPRGVVCGGLTKWHAAEIEKWLAGLERRPVKPLTPKEAEN